MRSYDAYLALVEEALAGVWTDFGPIPQRLQSAMDYTLSAGGKRLRPVLLLAACELGGGTAEEALPWACALEMIHTYSLIHDDLPAMDNDDTRRGKPSNHRVYGEALAILAGDGLLSAAMELMLRAACQQGDLRGTQAAEAIARRCGVAGMVAGQTLDMAAEAQPPAMDEAEAALNAIHLHKTADLLTAPLEAGLLLAGADEAALRQGIAYGQHLGVAFQIWDDVLDETGDPAALGKAVHQDSAHHKLTWVSVRGLEGAKADALQEAERAAAALAPLGEGSDFFREIAYKAVSRKN